jgi:hypothetical protein
MNKLASTLAVCAFATSTFVAGYARADSTGCSAAVKSAIDKAFPKASVSRCKAEHDHGREVVEVKLTKADGNRAEVDVTPDGKIVQIEEKITLDKVPAAVMKAFAQKYPKAKVDTAEKQTPSEGAPAYELAFGTDKGRAEATFREDGTFVEEE